MPINKWAIELWVEALRSGAFYSIEEVKAEAQRLADKEKEDV